MGVLLSAVFYLDRTKAASVKTLPGSRSFITPMMHFQRRLCARLLVNPMRHVCFTHETKGLLHSQPRTQSGPRLQPQPPSCQPWLRVPIQSWQMWWGRAGSGVRDRRQGGAGEPPGAAPLGLSTVLWRGNPAERCGAQASRTCLPCSQHFRVLMALGLIPSPAPRRPCS